MQVVHPITPTRTDKRLNPLLWLNIGNLTLLDAPLPQAQKRWMVMQCLSVWTVAFVGPFSVIDLITGAGWIYTAPVTLVAAFALWHSSRKMAVTTPACKSDYVAIT